LTGCFCSGGGGSGDGRGGDLMLERFANESYIKE